MLCGSICFMRLLVRFMEAASRIKYKYRRFMVLNWIAFQGCESRKNVN